MCLMLQLSGNSEDLNVNVISMQIEIKVWQEIKHTRARYD